MNRILQYILTITFTVLSYFPSILIASTGLFILSSCNVSYNTIKPELIDGSQHFTVYQKNLFEVNGKSNYIINDSTGAKLLAFTVSGVRSENQRKDWSLQISPTLSVLFEREHTLQVDITNNVDSTKRTLICIIHETTEGELTEASQGDTVLILDAKGKIGFFIYPIFLRQKYEEFMVELFGTQTTIKHHKETVPGNDLFVFYSGDEYVAAIGNMQQISFGNMTYNIYIRNSVPLEYQKDIFFFYVATKALSRIQDEILRLQRKE